jgi:hypothetical protein
MAIYSGCSRYNMACLECARDYTPLFPCLRSPLRSWPEVFWPTPRGLVSSGRVIGDEEDLSLAESLGICDLARATLIKADGTESRFFTLGRDGAANFATSSAALGRLRDAIDK